MSWRSLCVFRDHPITVIIDRNTSENAVKLGIELTRFFAMLVNEIRLLGRVVGQVKQAIPTVTGPNLFPVVPTV